MDTGKRIYHKISRELKYAGHNLQQLSGLNSHFYRNACGSRIMIYHGISPKNYSRFNPIFLSLKTLEEHIKFYKKHFNVVSLADLYRHRVSSKQFNICLTFDDGFANNYHYVLPLLKQYNVPATFFVTAIRHAGYDVLWNDFLTIVSKYGPVTLQYKKQVYYKNSYNRYISTESAISLAQHLRSENFDERMVLLQQLYPHAPFRENGFDADLWLQMTEEQIKEMAASPLVSIGAHGHVHNDLAQLDTENAESEMRISKQYLENLIQKPVNSLAFPYGSYTPQVVAAAKNMGYTQLLAMDFYTPADHTDTTMKERFTVNPYISVANQMRAVIKGDYGV